jgi:hypothetical protein
VRVLSVRQPFAGLIACGQKDVENRSWLPPDDLIGRRIGIHSALALAGKEWGPVPDGSGEPLCGLRGFVLGSVRLVGVVDDSPSEWALPGWHHWLLTDARRLRRPIQMRGARGLWELTQADPR